MTQRAIRLIMALVLVFAAASACSTSGSSKVEVHGTVTVDNPLGPTACGHSGWRIKVANSSGKILTVITSGLGKGNASGTCRWRYTASLPATSVYTFTVEDSVIEPLTVNRSDIKNGKVPDLYGVA